MKKTVFIYLFAFLTGLVVYSCGPNDDKVRNDVQNVITNSYPGITVSTKDRVVTLSGTVDSEEMRSAAEQAAKSVNNVKSVVNNIQVREQAETPNYGSSFNNDVRPDYELREHVESALSDAGYDDIDIEVTDGEIRLTGDVDRDDLTRIMQIANESNPRRVVNELTVR